MTIVQGNSIECAPRIRTSPISVIAWGFMAGLAGTIAMDLTMAGGLYALGLPADTCYRTIGSTVAHFFHLFGLHLVGEFALGASAYHLIGPLLGSFYGLIVSQVSTLQRTSLKKALLYAVLYAEIVSQLILIMVPVLLRMPAQEAILWFAGSSVLHAIWGVVMGSSVNYLVQQRVPITKQDRNARQGEI